MLYSTHGSSFISCSSCKNEHCGMSICHLEVLIYMYPAFFIQTISQMSVRWLRDKLSFKLLASALDYMLKPVIVSERVGVRFIQIDLYSISDHEFQGVFLSLLWKFWQQSVTVAQYSNSFAFKFLASQLRPLEKLSLLRNKFPNCFNAHRASSSYQDTLSSLDSLLLQC